MKIIHQALLLYRQRSSLRACNTLAPSEADECIAEAVDNELDEIKKRLRDLEARQRRDDGA